jgi:hypothetical protein
MVVGAEKDVKQAILCGGDAEESTHNVFSPWYVRWECDIWSIN